MLGLDKTQVFRPGALLTSVIDMFMFFIGNSDTSLLLFLKCHIYKPVNSDGMFNTFKRS